MEQFLNIPNPIGFLWLILVGLSMMIAFLVLKFTKLEWDDVLVGWYQLPSSLQFLFGVPIK